MTGRDRSVTARYLPPSSEPRGCCESTAVVNLLVTLRPGSPRGRHRQAQSLDDRAVPVPGGQERQHRALPGRHRRQPRPRVGVHRHQHGQPARSDRAGDGGEPLPAGGGRSHPGRPVRQVRDDVADPDRPAARHQWDVDPAVRERLGHLSVPPAAARLREGMAPGR